jgi:hypothetical protein
MDILKEKLGNLVLPMIADFVTELTKQGGIVETVGKFLTDMANPKTEPGKMFKDIKDAVKDAFQQVKDFFALFGNGDAMKGFGNVAAALVKMLPALLALKGIMMLASATNTIKNLAQAMGLIAAKGSVPGVGTPPVVAGAKPSLGIVKSLGFLAIGAEALLAGSEMTNNAAVERFKKQGIDLAALQASGMNARMLQTEAGIALARKKFPYQTNVTINVTAADPKSTVDAVSKYVKQNGSLPGAWSTGTGKKP